MVVGTRETHSVDDKQFWESLYQSKTIPWDLGQASPPLQTFLSSPYAVRPGSILVLGCGTGHDCMLFANKGFTVTGVDFAPSAIQATYQQFLSAGIAGTRGFLLERDAFQIHEYDHYFDYVLDHNFFSAIDPSRRRTYAQTVRDLLKPNGKLISLWWTLDKPGGPPFGVSKDSLYTLFGEFFGVDIAFTPTNSVPARQGHEFFTLMTRF